jgi:hypothetical protein
MASLGSQDAIEDAVEKLHESPFQYLLITGTSTTASRFDSALSEDAREMLLDWVRSGELEKQLLVHFNQNPI